MRRKEGIWRYPERGAACGGEFQTAHMKEASTMTIQTNTTDRKALAKAIERIG